MESLEFKIQSRPSLKPVALRRYASLRSAVRKTMALGRGRAMAAVERERVRTAWEVGHLILKHVLLNEARAGYGGKVIAQLSRDLSVSVSEMRYMLEFARTYPIHQPAGELSWSHYQTLLAVNEPRKRDSLIKRAIQENWTRKRLRSEIKKIKAPAQTKGPSNTKSLEILAEPKAGKPGVYQIVQWRTKMVYDLGFTTYFETKKRRAKGGKEPGVEDLYYYQGVVDRVVDGDTVWVDIHLGFGIWSYQKLRLRGINAAETISESGQKAKRYLTRKLPKGAEVLLKTTRPDKFDRYLADLWVGESYVNQQLLSAGHARMVG